MRAFSKLCYCRWRRWTTRECDAIASESVQKCLWSPNTDTRHLLFQLRVPLICRASSGVTKVHVVRPGDWKGSRETEMSDNSQWLEMTEGHSESLLVVLSLAVTPGLCTPLWTPTRRVIDVSTPLRSLSATDRVPRDEVRWTEAGCTGEGVRCRVPKEFYVEFRVKKVCHFRRVCVRAIKRRGNETTDLSQPVCESIVVVQDEILEGSSFHTRGRVGWWILTGP